MHFCQICRLWGFAFLPSNRACSIHPCSRVLTDHLSLFALFPSLLFVSDSYTVAYFTGGLQTPTLLASSDAVEFSNYHVPLHLHLALTDDPTQMRVNWNSKQNSFPSLNYGTDPKNLNNSILRVLTTTYKSTDMCGEPATTTGWRDPGYMHSALITDLTPNTLYYYQVGDESSQSKSDVYSFYSAPVPAASTEVDFFIFGGQDN